MKWASIVQGPIRLEPRMATKTLVAITIAQGNDGMAIKALVAIPMTMAITIAQGNTNDEELAEKI